MYDRYHDCIQRQMQVGRIIRTVQIVKEYLYVCIVMNLLACVRVVNE